MAYLTTSDEFLNYIEEYFFFVSKYVLDYINKKIDAIKKYYFNDTYIDEFYKLEIREKEIYKFADNINNYFNEMILESDIKSTILKISVNEIHKISGEKDKKLDKLYNDIYKRTQKSRIHSSNCDLIKHKIKKKRKWYTFGVTYKLVYKYYCYKKVKSRNNINKIVKNLSIPVILKTSRIVSDAPIR